MVSTTPPAVAIDLRERGDVNAWLARLAVDRAPRDVEVIRRAWELAERAHAGQQRASGEPYFRHATAVAGILAELRLDPEAIAAAILHDVVEDTPVTLDEVRRDFGERVARLVDGVTKMQAIQGLKGANAAGNAEQTQAESLRKMLLAMAEDVDVVLIKLADRLHNMRTLGHLPEDKRRRIARETLDIFAPLANRLGIWQLKWELEDLSFRYLEPATYRHIAALLAEKRVDRERYIEELRATLAQELTRAGVAAEVTGRPKHIYGIWRKMQRKGKDFAQITDVRGVRVLTESVRGCYAALGVVHGLWQYVPGEFDDYIATPKENYYRSIHTAVIGPQGKLVEVQIRTREMHQQSELGVAAHWRYKESVAADVGFDRKIAWLRSLLEWKDEIAEASEFVDQFKSEVFSERVYVFTPKGRIIDLPADATPLDFAYHVHTDVGHRCRGAKVDGRIVPLTYTLKTGEQVEVLTVKEGGPSRDWLNPHLGYLRSSRARSKVQHWFRQQNYAASVADGRAALEREFHRLGLADVNYERLRQKFGFVKVEDFLAGIGRGDVKPSQIANAVQELVELRPSEARPAAAAPQLARPPKAAGGVAIQGIGNLMTRIARCCNPVPGDAIVGFITRGHGITVHRDDCPNALRHHGEEGERLIEVRWGADPGELFPVDVDVTAYDRAGLLRDVTALLANERINVLGVQTVVDRQQVAHMTFKLSVPNVDTLSRVLALIDRVPNVTRVRRKSG